MKSSNQIPIMTNLQLIRKEKGLTIKAIADIVDCTEKTYAKYEQAEAPQIEPVILQALMDYYQVSADFILNRTRYRHPENTTACAATGLPEEAIQALKDLAPDLKATLCRCLASGYADLLLSNIQAFLSISPAAYTDKKGNKKPLPSYIATQTLPDGSQRVDRSDILTTQALLAIQATLHMIKNNP